MGFFRWKRFASESGFADLEIFGGYDAHIRRDFVARIKEDNIAGHQFLRGHFFLAAVAQNERFSRKRADQGIDGGFGLGLLYETDDGIDQHNCENDCRIEQIFYYRSDDAGSYQQDHERVVELFKEPEERALPLFSGDNVASEPLLPARNLELVKAEFRIRV